MNEGIIARADSGLSDGEVVSRIQAGERELYAILVERHNRRLQRILCRILRNPCDVEDVLQKLIFTRSGISLYSKGVPVFSLG
jgi:hypothetical protein